MIVSSIEPGLAVLDHERQHVKQTQFMGLAYALEFDRNPRYQQARRTSANWTRAAEAIGGGTSLRGLVLCLRVGFGIAVGGPIAETFSVVAIPAEPATIVAGVGLMGIGVTGMGLGWRMLTGP